MSAHETGAPDAPRARTCPARSPETGARCALPDTWRAHDAAQGCHESEIVDSTRAVWAPTWKDLKRWLDEPGAVSQYVAGEDARHGTHKSPRRGCPSCIGGVRVKSAVHVLDQMYPIEMEDPGALVRLLLAADDLRPRFNTGGLLPLGAITGPVIFGADPPPMPPGMADEIRRLAQRRMERGQ